MNIFSFGAGEMARALLIPMYREAAGRGEVHFTAYSPCGTRAVELAGEMGGQGIKDLKDSALLKKQDYYFLCCKPQQFAELAGEIRHRLNPRGVVVSLLAGTPLEAISQGLGQQRVVRLMPNTPSKVGAGESPCFCRPQSGEGALRCPAGRFEKGGQGFFGG